MIKVIYYRVLAKKTVKRYGITICSHMFSSQQHAVYKEQKMLQNCNKNINKVIFWIKHLIYYFILAPSFYAVFFLIPFGSKSDVEKAWCPRDTKAQNMCKIFPLVPSKKPCPEKTETNQVFTFQFLNDKRDQNTNFAKFPSAKLLFLLRWI